MNKVVYVPAHFQAIGKEVTKKVATGEKKAGFFGGEKDVTKKIKEWEQTGFSDRWVDGERLSNDIAGAVDELNKNGYEVVTVTSVTSGNYDYSYKSTGSGHNGDSGYGYGYGYSYTEGVTIIAKKSV
ncbi:hypothetical protein DFP80_12150 [Marinomonas rhizomae]|uniref:Uncharacterized protein n=1 Tax=Marinomonas rhizomae TaxID=491948 RepID=A0A366ITZ3_9GAMM|nr:hypothetical protein [Marinomonas rhizomae]RBP78262.1 hypothetical protein DFP80_12150 [Marinomonas rhizomae]